MPVKTKPKKTPARKRTTVLGTRGLPRAKALKLAGDIVTNALVRSKAEAKRHDKVPAFSDSFTTEDSCFSVEVKEPWGEVTEDIEIKIDCVGYIHGDEDLIDLLIEMLEGAKHNLIARRGFSRQHDPVRWEKVGIR